MATKVVMEALSPTMEEGRLVKWLKNEGDAVSSGDVLAEVETDKAVMELVARGEGVLRKRLANEGDSSPVGTLLAVIGAADENIDQLVTAAAGAARSAAGAGGAAAESRGASGDGGARSGERVEERAASPEQAAASPRERAGASPVPRDREESQGEASMPPQEKMPRGGPPAPVSTGAPARAAGAPGAAPAPPRGEGNGGRLRSSPLARRLASERGVDLGEISGSGPGGRIVKRDIEAAGTAAPARTTAPAAATARREEGFREEAFRDVPLTQIRKTIARRLVESIGPIPTFYLTAEFDLERVGELRTAMAEMGDEFKVSYNDIIMKAVATALAQHPECNAHWLGDRIREFSRVHLGMAVATDEGLIVPVIFDADEKGLREIAAEARALAGRARERKLKPEEYTGSTFSVSNLGMFGIDQFTAIINPPEAGILAIGAIEKKQVVIKGEMQLRNRLRVTMSCDHRVIDGAIGARFLQTLRRMLENPLMLIY
jgi:pyruvate dehydrogenase E2 component (dihydrolipoamide acetyltransferase)